MNVNFEPMKLDPNKMEVYESLTNLEKHYFTEELMGDRIKLSYRAAIDLFHSCIRSNEDLWNAYQNFLISKDDINFLSDKDVLVFAAVDKFQKELHFIVRNCLDNSITVKIYDVDSENFSLNENITDTGTDGSNRKSYRKNCKLGKLQEIYFGFRKNVTNSNKWNHAILDYYKGTVNHRVFYIYGRKQEYTKDDDYPYVEKTFSSNGFYIEDNSVDDAGCMRSIFNPAHAPLLPDDLQQSYTTKNARSAI